MVSDNSVSYCCNTLSLIPAEQFTTARLMGLKFDLIQAERSFDFSLTDAQSGPEFPSWY